MDEPSGNMWKNETIISQAPERLKYIIKKVQELCLHLETLQELTGSSQTWIMINLIISVIYALLLSHLTHFFVPLYLFILFIY